MGLALSYNSKLSHLWRCPPLRIAHSSTPHGRLRYHDPELCAFLDTHKLSPLLYALKWVLTLFAYKCEVEPLCMLWDHLLLGMDPFQIYFVSLAHLSIIRAGAAAHSTVCIHHSTSVSRSTLRIR